MSHLIQFVALPATPLWYSGINSDPERCKLARKANPKQLKKLYQAVEAHPGKRPGFFAQLLGMHRSQVMRSLPSLEDQGYLLSEDEKGRLWTYRHIRHRK